MQRGVGEGFAAELQRHLFVVIAVNVAIAAGPDEVTHIQIALLGHHVCEQGVAGDVEGHAQENVGAALVQLAAQTATLTRVLGGGDIKLEKRMARHQGHLVEFSHVPSTDDDAARVGVGLQGLDDFRNLVDVTAIWGGPAAPLHAVDGA